MGKRLERAPIGEARPGTFGQDTAYRLIDLMYERDRPFIDDINVADNVRNIRGYIHNSQELAMQNADDPEHEAFIQEGPERQKLKAERRGDTTKAVVSRLEELTVMHGAIAAHRLHHIEGSILPFIDTDKPLAPEAVLQLSDALTDLSHGLAKADIDTELGFDGNLSATVSGLAERIGERPALIRLTPYLPRLAATDQRQKRDFWTAHFRKLHAEYGFTGNPANILARLQQPEASIERLGLGEYFAADMYEAARRAEPLPGLLGRSALS